MMTFTPKGREQSQKYVTGAKLHNFIKWEVNTLNFYFIEAEPSFLSLVGLYFYNLFKLYIKFLTDYKTLDEG